MIKKKSKLFSAGLPILIIVSGIVISNILVTVTAKDAEEKDAIPPPVVQVTPVTPENYQISISAWGELQPRETTQLSSIVAGEIVDIHPAFIAGGVVKKGEVLVQIDESDYYADLIQAESTLASAEANLEQEIALAEVAKEEWANIPKNKVSALALRKPQLLSARAQLKAAEAGYARAKKNLERCRVKAPYDALIVSRQVGLGQVANQGAVIGEIFNIESAEVQLPIAGFDAPFLPADFKNLNATMAVSDNSKLTRNVSIDRDLGLIDSRTRMNNLVAVIEDPYGLHNGAASVKFGSYVKVTVPGIVVENVVRVDQEVVVDDQVWIVDSNEQLVARDVTILREEQGKVLISAGLQSGEQLVIQVPEYPQNGMQVAVSTGANDIAKVE